MFCQNLHAVCIPMCHARVSHTHVCVCDTRVCIPMRYILMCLTHTQSQFLVHTLPTATSHLPAAHCDNTMRQQRKMKANAHLCMVQQHTLHHAATLYRVAQQLAATHFNRLQHHRVAKSWHSSRSSQGSDWAAMQSAQQLYR